MRIGALLRAYAQKPESLPSLQAGLTIAIDRLHEAGIADIVVGVWEDRGNPVADCGLTFEALRTSIGGHPGVIVYRTENGDAFVDILNDGLHIHRSKSISHSLILSWEASVYVDTELVKKMISCVNEGAKAVAVALPEIADFVREGAIMNTLALWDTEELLGVGGFDPKDRKPRVSDHYASSNAGVGEFIPLLKMCEKAGKPLLAIITPAADASIDIPPERMELHKKKIASKRVRIEGMLKEIGKSAADLRACIMR